MTIFRGMRSVGYAWKTAEMLCCQIVAIRCASAAFRTGVRGRVPVPSAVERQGPVGSYKRHRHCRLGNSYQGKSNTFLPLYRKPATVSTRCEYFNTRLHASKNTTSGMKFQLLIFNSDKNRRNHLPSPPD
ncbi:hypothetical protein SDJN02_06381, partial [Cucurbita argyrosperma subsp. argyrosperma]